MNYILIIDDSKMIVKGFEHHISQMIPNTKCLVGYSKKDAQAILKEYGSCIDCALLDLQLPDALDGSIVDFVSKYKIPIIVLSGQLELEKNINKNIIVDYIIKDGLYSFYYATNKINQILKNKSITVLAVDDSKVALQKIAYYLKNYNLNVLMAQNGQEALKVLKENPQIKLMYTDYNMPIMNGLELIREARKIYSKNKLSIIVVSSQSDSKTTSTLLKYGANDFLDKGYTPEEFYARLTINLEIIELFDNIEKEYEKNREKDKIILEQNKMSAMADLIKNISHHWRQPLNAISTNADSIKIEYELDMLDQNEIPKKMKSIVESTQFLAKTIDSFRDMISENVEIKEIIIQEEIKKALDIQRFNLEDRNIVVKKYIQDEQIVKNMPVGELSKVLTYILNNVTDILSTKDADDRWVEISLYTENKTIFITVEDNGGGVSPEILPNIFEPYTTTKHQDQGRGLGMHMSYKIVTQNLDGKLYINNTENGAKVTIELPLS